MHTLKHKFLNEIQHNEHFSFAQIKDSDGTLHKAEILFFPIDIPPEHIGTLFHDTIQDQSLFDFFPEFLKKQITASLAYCESHSCEKVNINIPLEIFEHENADQVIKILKDVSTPSSLCLEITENSKAQNLGSLTGLFTQLSQLGYSFVLDDLGSGYHDLTIEENRTYLKELLQNCPIQDIKIDYELVKDFEENSDHIKENIAIFEDIYKDLGRDPKDLTITFEYPLDGQQQERAKKLTSAHKQFFQTIASIA